ncbi:hypothetical protein C1645_880554 [Glomus cerebriforme]|uniref:Uncharacterized protein n=1 Tax=Glomus cerebriforme TaxID=658196 RepID=A0A397SBL2_9GLOM|nr:hypothetical protein C1645_880554 [Glomus cerebriforme]
MLPPPSSIQAKQGLTLDNIHKHWWIQGYSLVQDETPIMVLQNPKIVSTKGRPSEFINKRKNDDTLVHIKLPNILPEIFQMILRNTLIQDKKLQMSDIQTWGYSGTFITQDNEEFNSNNFNSLQHIELILKWINMNNSNLVTSIFSKLIFIPMITTNITFKLLFRGSRDGFAPS